MIDYTSSKQISIEEFEHPFGAPLSKENRWVRLAELLPWDELVRYYTSRMSKERGRKAVDPRVAVGALILKHMLRLPDEETIEMIKENPYLQYFLGFKAYQYKQPFTPSLFVTIRRRLGSEVMAAMSSEFMNHVRRIEREIKKQKKVRKKSEVKGKEKGKDKDSNDDPPSSSSSESFPPNRGHLIVDSTVAPSDIKYPTDLDLLNEAREKSEYLIDKLYRREAGKEKPRTYRRKARKDYLSASRIKRNRKKLRKGIKKQLNYLGRNLRTIEKLLDEYEEIGLPFPLSSSDQRLYWIIQELYRQQKEMYANKSRRTFERIVSIHQPYIRPIVRGKSGREVEFGAKISLSVVDGYVNIDRISWSPYNEGGDLIEQIENYKERYGFYPEYVSADKIYGNRKNRSYMKSKGIKFTGSILGRPRQNYSEAELEERKKLKAKGKQRSIIEGIFGIAKRKYELDPVKAKTKETSENWIQMVYFVMNVARFMRVIFCFHFKLVHIWIKNQLETWFSSKKWIYSLAYI